MNDYEWAEYLLGVTVSDESCLPHVRIRDPWWRKPLVALRLAKPGYRPGKLSDLIYGDGAILPRKLRGFDIYGQ